MVSPSTPLRGYALRATDNKTCEVFYYSSSKKWNKKFNAAMLYSQLGFVKLAINNMLDSNKDMANYKPYKYKGLNVNSTYTIQVMSFKLQFEEIIELEGYKT